MPRRLPIPLPVASLILLAGSVAAATLPADHQAYIWQRVWNDKLAAATLAMADDLAGYRVLIAEAQDASLHVFATDWRALAAARRPVTLVLRIPGFRPTFSTPVLVAAIDDARAQAKAAGVDVRGVEIDHDCARSRLPAYAQALRALRGALSRDVALSITVLPDWLQSSELEAVLAGVDTSVLQLHAVLPPDTGLFDAALALRWTRAYARRAPHAFRVALPAYATRVSQDAAGRIIAIESETQAPRFDADARELQVDPRRLAVVIARLALAPPPRFAGYAWFRLPLGSDRRAYHQTTLRRLVRGEAVDATVVAFLVDNGAAGGFDVQLRNASAIDALAPRHIDLPARCADGEGVAGYTRNAGGQLETAVASVLRPGAVLTIGWLICAAEKL